MKFTLPPRPCGEILTDPDGFTARCMVSWGTEHSHHDMTARESVTAGNEVIDGRGTLFDADGYPIEKGLTS